MLFDSPIITSNVLKQTKNQIYIAPHPLLRNYIAHYTFSFPIPHTKDSYNREAKDLTLIPDASGCMIYTYSNGHLSQHLWGPTTKIVNVKNEPDSNIHRFFIEFLPGGLYAITGIPQSELSDRQYTINEVDSPLSLPLMHIIEASKNLNEVVSKMNAFFLRTIDARNKVHIPLLPIISHIKYYKGNLQIKNLAQDAFISQRHLGRLFERHIGMNAKQFTRLVRINKAVDLYKTGLYATSSEVAQALGFFDESHLIRDFKELCNTTPNVFLKNMSNFYNEPFKY